MITSPPKLGPCGRSDWFSAKEDTEDAGTGSKRSLRTVLESLDDGRGSSTVTRDLGVQLLFLG